MPSTIVNILAGQDCSLRVLHICIVCGVDPDRDPIVAPMANCYMTRLALLAEQDAILAERSGEEMQDVSESQIKSPSFLRQLESVHPPHSILVPEEARELD